MLISLNLVFVKGACVDLNKKPEILSVHRHERHSQSVMLASFMAKKPTAVPNDFYPLGAICGTYLQIDQTVHISVEASLALPDQLLQEILRSDSESLLSINMIYNNVHVYASGCSWTLPLKQGWDF